MTHRRQLLEKLARARAFHGRWPEWLRARVDELSRRRISSREIAEIVLEESGVFIKPRSVNKRRSGGHSSSSLTVHG